MVGYGALFELLAQMREAQGIGIEGVPWLERSCRLGWILRKQFQRTIRSAGRTFRPVHAGLTR